MLGDDNLGGDFASWMNLLMHSGKCFGLPVFVETPLFNAKHLPPAKAAMLADMAYMFEENGWMRLDGDLALASLRGEGGSTSTDVMMPDTSTSRDTVRLLLQYVVASMHVLGGLKDMKARRQASGTLPSELTKEVLLRY